MTVAKASVLKALPTDLIDRLLSERRPPVFE